MKAPVLVVKKLPAFGMALFPFILLKSADYKKDTILLNHEKIHLRQQLELLVLPFYVCYLANYLINRLKYKNHYEAYRNIIFEKEAFDNERNLGYLKKRSWFSWAHHK
ncbi:hypothetical protein ABIB40_001004 [Pedobacter sp. UYP30]|uniref:hypothetical protein n=1 Tax=Pedobacter sp. UYP30 TaxID=1756400 RepID=UPI0033960041